MSTQTWNDLCCEAVTKVNFVKLILWKNWKVMLKSKIYMWLHVFQHAQRKVAINDTADHRAGNRFWWVLYQLRAVNSARTYSHPEFIDINSKIWSILIFSM